MNGLNNLKTNKITEMFDLKNKTFNNSYIVINDNSFYKKGTILIKHIDGLFAPSINDYSKHCHFLTEDFILSKPLIFKKK